MADSSQADDTHEKAANVKWHDPHIDPEEKSQEPVALDEDSFLARSKRRISEHPQISKIQLARKSSKHRISFLVKVLMIIASSKVFKVFFFLMRLIPISKIVMSAIFFNDCPVEKIIIYYLLIGGLLSAVRDVIAIIVKNCFNQDCLAENEVVLTLVTFLYTVGEFVWFIFGSVYVFMYFGDYPWKQQSGDDGYCNNILYMYAFVVTGFSYGLLLLVFIISCCTVCLAKVTDTHKSPSRPSK